MKTKLVIAAGLFVAHISNAALVGTGVDAWSLNPTPFDPAINQLYSHLQGGSNVYLTPDSNENRFANGTTLGQFEVTGLDHLDLIALGNRAGDTNFFGIRIYVGADSYELTLTPSTTVGAAKRTYFASVNEILASAGGSALDYAGVNGAVTTQIAKLDFFIYDIDKSVKIFSSGIDNGAQAPTRPAFNFTPDLLTSPGPSTATPLPASKALAKALLTDEGFQVWGFEDSRGFNNTPGKLEPDYNDRIIAFRIVPVPEPSTYGLIGVAVLAAAITLRRRAKAAIA